MSHNQFLNKKTKKRKKREKDENKDENKDEKEKETETNIIIGIIKVEKSDLKLRIINSFENAQEENMYLMGIRNEEDIKDCEIFINDEKINFSYYYDFENEGNYKIKYIFKKLFK